MIYITGDTHGDLNRFRYMKTEDGREPQQGDYLIICGDFGFLFRPRGHHFFAQQEQNLRDFENLPYTVLFVDGNHENFDLIEEYPVENWCGGKVHRLAENVLHLMRGQVFTIEGSKLFTMGGAYSIDKYMREEGESWWARELPDQEEYAEAVKNLEAAGKQVDIIITHTAPREIVRRMRHEPDCHDIELTGFLEWVMYETTFKKWYFGHWHTDGDVTDRVRAVYYDVVTYPPANTTNK